MHNAKSKLKKVTITACLKALAPLNSTDCNNEEYTSTLIKAKEIIQNYPELFNGNNRIIKQNDPDYYVNSVKNIIHNCLIGKPPENAILVLNERLKKAIEYL